MEGEFQPRKVILDLITNNGKFLLIRRKIPELKVEWAFPGGIIEIGESEEAAAVREAKEEACLDVIPKERLLERKHPNTLVQVVYYHCVLKSSDQAKIGQDDEIAEIAWVPAHEVLNKFTSDVDPVIKNFIFSL